MQSVQTSVKKELVVSSVLSPVNHQGGEVEEERWYKLSLQLLEEMSRKVCKEAVSNTNTET